MKTISLVTNLQFFVLGGNFWKGKTDEMGIASPLETAAEL